MAGVKGRSGRKSHLEEWNYQECILKSNEQIISAFNLLNEKIAKYGLEEILRSDDKDYHTTDYRTNFKAKKFSYLRRLYYKLIDISQNLVIKSIPSKIQSNFKGSLEITSDKELEIRENLYNAIRVGSEFN